MSKKQMKVMKLNTQYTIMYSQLLDKLNYQPLRYSTFTITMYTETTCLDNTPITNKHRSSENSQKTNIP